MYSFLVKIYFVKRFPAAFAKELKRLQFQKAITPEIYVICRV